MSNLTWLSAKASNSGGVFPVDMTDWPEVMTASQLAAIQRPRKSGDPQGRRLQAALKSAIEGAMRDGALVSRELSRNVRRPTKASQEARSRWLYMEIPFDDNRHRYAPEPELKYEEVRVTVVGVGPADFARWLQSQGEEPSAHVAAWVKAAGGAAAAPVSAFPLADWSALVAYRKANARGGKGPDWSLGNQIDIGKAELKRRQDAGATETDALNAMGADLELKAGRKIKKSLSGERKRGKAAQGQQAQPLPSTVVRSGKKAA